MDLFLLSGDLAGVYAVPSWAAEPTRKGTITYQPHYKIPKLGTYFDICFGSGEGKKEKLRLGGFLGDEEKVDKIASWVGNF